MSYLFSLEQGNLLIRLLLAHLVADFMLQTKSMVKDKNWFSQAMLLHIFLVFALSILLSGGMFITSVIIALSHWILDGLKVKLTEKKSIKEYSLFLIDQGLHIAIIVVLWAYHFNLFSPLLNALLLPFTNYNMSILLTGYVFIIWPMGFFIKFALDKMELLTEVKFEKSESLTERSNLNNESLLESNTKIKNAGKLIGQFERIIILTFILLQQYEAIGFLITGKSIIRFAQKDENLKSEYILVGTMMSYALSILTGLAIRALLI